MMHQNQYGDGISKDEEREAFIKQLMDTNPDMAKGSLIHEQCKIETELIGDCNVRGYLRIRLYHLIAFNEQIQHIDDYGEDEV
jgi:hypothetical protein